MKRRRLTIGAIVCVALCATRLQADVDAPIKALPGNSAVVIRIANPDATVAKLGEMASGIDPVAAATVQLMGAGAGTIIDNPAKQGLKPGTDWWVAVIARKNAPPAMIFAVQASDLAQLKDGVGNRYQYVTYENWTLYTRDADAAKAVQDCISGSAKSIEPAGNDEIKQLFTDADTAVFVNLAELKVTFKSELDQMREQVHQLLSMVQAEAPDVPGINMEAAIGLYAQLFEGILSAVDDSDSLTAAINVDAKGLLIREYLEVKSGSQTEKALLQHKPAKLASLANLPGDQTAYMGLHADMGVITRWGMKLMGDMFDLDDESKKALAVAADKSAELEYGSTVASFGFGQRQTGYMNSATISEVKNAIATRDVEDAMYAALAKLKDGESLFGGMEIESKRDAEKVAGYSVDHLLVTQEINEELDPLGIQKQVMEALYGPEGQLTRIVYAPDHIIQTSGGGKEFLERTLAGLKTPVSNDALASTRTKLGADANLLVALDLPGMLVEILHLVADNAPPGMLPLPPGALNNLEVERSYSGFTVTLGAGGVRAHSFMPVEQMHGIYKLVTFGMTFAQPQF